MSMATTWRGFAAALGRPVEDVSPLRSLRFGGEVWAIPEGRVFLAGKPLLKVTARCRRAQLVVHYSLDVPLRHGRQQADFSAPRP